MALLTQLNTLESSGLICLAAAQPELEYLFRHALIQDAAYGSLVKQDRKRLHREVGEALERMYPDQLASRELAPRLGEHFYQAGDDQRALKYFTLAGDAAARGYANAEAVLHYTRALEVATRATHLAGAKQLKHLYTYRGHALELSAQDAQALENYEDMEATARQRGDRSLELAALIARATIYFKPATLRDPARGQAVSERALALARELGDRRAEAKTLWNLLIHHKFASHFSEALECGEQALAIARELNLREQIAYVLHDIYPVYLALEQAPRAWAALQESQQLWRELGILNMLADSLASSAELRVLGGEYEQAFALSEEALRISRAIGNLWNQSYSWYMIDLAYADRGEMGQAIEVAEECLRLAQQAGFLAGLIQSAFDLAYIYGYLGAVRRGYEVIERIRGATEGVSHVDPFISVTTARLHLLSGRLAEAGAAFDAARRGFTEAQLQSSSFWFLGLIDAELALARGDYARLLALTDEAIPLLRKTGIRLFFPDTLHFKSKALLSLGRVNQAEQVLAEARAEAEALGSRRSLWPILMALSEIEAQRGNPAEARALRRQARAIAEFIADHAGSPELRETFLGLADVQNVMRPTGMLRDET